LEGILNNIGFFVELVIEPSGRESFDRLMREHSKATLATEEGCLVFDVYVHSDDPNRYALFELYADEAALDTHRFSAQLAKHRQEIDHFIKDVKILTIGDEVDRSNFPGKKD
jgi:quinol monooxygenase YgiN|tara:strand:- start:84 stop:419 length:336 start_codon:yes stop_codon:yes gene_type:complete